MSRPASHPHRAASVLLWIAQAALAALFLFAGGMKLVMPLAAFQAQSPLPGWLIRAVGVLEVLGALGLVLPGVLRLPRELTVAAAAGLVLVMCGAVGATVGNPATAANAPMVLMPVAVGALAAVVAFGRARALRRGVEAARPSALARPAAIARPA